MRLILVLASIVLGINSVYATGIDTAIYVSIGGIEQYLSIQGQETTKSLLLYLHGGPGQAASPKEREIIGSLNQDYLLVYWDQRNAGKTLEKNVDSSQVSLALMQSDAEEVFLFLLKHFDRAKLTLVANSWGNVLAFSLANKYPDKIEQFVAISPDIHATKSQKTALKRLKKYFKSQNNEAAIAELSSISIPHVSIQEMILQYKWESIYNGETVTDEMIAQYMPFFNDWEAKWMYLYHELYDWNLYAQIKELQCPITFFVGTEDYTANFHLAERFYKKLKAPQKRLFYFESAHNIFAHKPALLQQQLAACLAPKD